MMSIHFTAVVCDMTAWHMGTVCYRTTSWCITLSTWSRTCTLSFLFGSQPPFEWPLRNNSASFLLSSTFQLSAIVGSCQRARVFLIKSWDCLFATQTLHCGVECQHKQDRKVESHNKILYDVCSRYQTFAVLRQKSRFQLFPWYQFSSKLRLFHVVLPDNFLDFAFWLEIVNFPDFQKFHNNGWLQNNTFLLAHAL